MNIYLRPFEEKDIEKFEYWFTKCTDWQSFDAPWEWQDYIFNHDEQFQNRMAKSKNSPCFEYEIIYENEHIGWISAYYMTDDFKWNSLNQTDKIAIGIDIPDPKYRNLGIGKYAYLKYIEYFKSFGIKEIYTQTWSGNFPMINLALSAGFKEVNRYKNLRNVNGKNFDALTFKLDLTSTPTIIRKAKIEDCETISKLKLEIWETTYRGIYPDSKFDNYDFEKNTAKFKEIIEKENTHLYVVTHNDIIVGYVNFGIPWRPFKDYTHDVTLLYLRKDFQKCGLGKQLFNLAYDYFRSIDVHRFFISCSKDNMNGRAFYEKMGGVIVDSGDNNDEIPQVKFEYLI